MNAELEKLDENIHEKPSEDAGSPKRYYFENLKISIPQVKLSVFTSHKLPPDLKVTQHDMYDPQENRKRAAPPKTNLLPIIRLKKIIHTINYIIITLHVI